MKLRMGKSGYGSTIGLITQTLPFVNHRTVPCVILWNLYFTTYHSWEFILFEFTFEIKYDIINQQQIITNLYSLSKNNDDFLNQKRM